MPQNELVRLAPGVQVAHVGIKLLLANILCNGHVVFASMTPVALNAVLGNQLLKLGDGIAADTDRATRKIDIIGRCEVVRQVDSEA